MTTKMNFKISKLPQPLASFTHKIEFFADAVKTNLVLCWLREQGVDHRMVPYRSVSAFGSTVSVFLDDAATTAFVLRWQ